MCGRKILQNSKGQFLIETVLLMVISVGLFSAFVKVAQEGKWAAKMVGEPWGVAKGMIESGVWKKPSEAKALHPNQLGRSATWDPSQ